jgi:spermidine synthase
MKPEVLIDTTVTPEGTELFLYERDGVFTLRIGGIELMTSRAHGSEEELARMAMRLLGNTRRPRVLVGGLGMGYTLRAVLDSTPSPGEVVVAELLPAVVRWNREHLGELAGNPLEDPRVTVVECDLADLIADSPGSFDVILNDVDNGPSGFSFQRNERLYRAAGLSAIRRCLKPAGVLGVWSTDPDARFEHALAAAGFRVRTETVYARNVPKGHRHTLFLGRLP